MYDVVTLGETMAVLYPGEPIRLDDADTLRIDIGGAESNLAIALARQGVGVRFVSRVGDDPFGGRIRTTLDREGVDTTYLRVDTTAPTGVFFREWLPDGARRVYYYRSNSAAAHMTPDDLSAAMFEGVKVVHLTGITPALSATCAATVAHAMELAHAAGALVSFDPNYRARLWTSEAARVALLPLIAQADIVLLGHEDAAAVFGTTDDAATLGELAQLHAAICVLKRAERGAIALVAGKQISAPAVPVAKVIDPVGAGDGFNAGFLAAYLRGETTEAALHRGAQIGAACVATLGDYAGYPRR